MISTKHEVIYFMPSTTKMSSTMCGLRILYATFLALILNLSSASGDLVVETRINTPNIEIPVFDPSLGALQSVELRVAMLAGNTTSAGSHSHGSRVVLSDTILNSTPSISFPSQSLTTSASGSSSHAFLSPGYAGGGINIGSFSGSTSSSGIHNHQVTPTFAGFQQVGSNSWKVRASLVTGGTSGHTASYSSQQKTLNFSGVAVAPFLTASDIVIPAGSFSTSSNGVHNHSVSNFSRNVGSSIGPLNLAFPSSFTNASGSHSHVVDPRFSVAATFTFTAIPEPSSLWFGYVTMAICITRRRRDR